MSWNQRYWRLRFHVLKARRPICWIRGHNTSGTTHWAKGHQCGRCNAYLGWINSQS